MSPELSVVIPTYNRRLRLHDSLAALLCQSIDPSRYEIVVVDDGSDDGTDAMVAELARKSRPKVRYIWQEQSQAGTARNTGILAAQAPVILLMDSDILVRPDHVELHLHLHRKYPAQEVAVLGRVTPDLDGVDLLRRRDSDISPIGCMAGGESIISESCFVTADVSLKKAFIVQAGLFTPELPVDEDTDLALRLKARGLKLIYCRDAVAIHTEPLDTVEKVALSGKKYGRTFADWYGRIPLYQTEMWMLGGRFNGGWKHFRSHPWGYFKDALRRWVVNPWTIGIFLRWARCMPVSNSPHPVLHRLCKEIWAYYYRHDFYSRRRLQGTRIH